MAPPRRRQNFGEVAEQLTAVVSDNEVKDIVFQSNIRDGEQVIISTARELPVSKQRHIERIAEHYGLKVQFNFEG